MAVIATGMDMPKSCWECPLTEKMSCFNFDFEDSEKRPKDCPLKSVEGLIEKINNLSDTIRGIRSDGNCFFTPEEVIKIIKEYCELEESNEQRSID